MRIVVLGKNGQVGKTLIDSLSHLGEVVANGRDTVDLMRLEELRSLIRTQKPDVIVNAAAYTAVDRAEQEQELAFTINGMAPKILAEEAKKIDALFIHYSTDYVFDGKATTPYLEVDSTNPINVYGSSKLLGERGIQEVGGKYLILRTSWVYGSHGHNFYRTMLRLAAERNILKVVNDQVGCPTSAVWIADATAEIILSCLDKQKPTGIYHLSSKGETTWKGFAEEIFKYQGIAQITVEGIPTSAYPTPAKRPSYSVLKKDKLEQNFGIYIPTWQESLSEIVNPSFFSS